MNYKFFLFTYFLLSFLPISASAFYQINNSVNGGQCAQIGYWDDITQTCTLTADIDEQIIVSNSFITVDGNGHTIDMRDTGEAYAVNIDGVSVVAVENLVILGAGISFDAADGAIVRNNEIHDAIIGINVFNLDSASIENNVISGDTEPTAVAVVVESADHVTVSDNYIKNANDGIMLSYTSYPVIENNSIDTAETGISSNHYMTDASIINNKIANTYTALYFNEGDSYRNIIQGNVFVNSTTGVEVYALSGGGGDPVLGFVDMDRSWWSIITGVVFNYFGPEKALAQATDDVATFIQNNFINNDEHTNISGNAMSVFSGSAAEGGNYWDTYDELAEGCIDDDSDGFCDTPYEISDALAIDYFPYTEPIDNTFPTAACSDGVDNDGDGLTDYPEDPGCVTVDDRLEVNVPAPTCIINVEPATIEAGESTVLNWSSTNADSLEIDNGIGVTSKEGTLSVSPETTTTYTVIVEGSGGTASCQTTITIQSQEPQTLGEKAAELAKQVVDAPYLGDGETFGGKGWDILAGEFVSPETIFDGYNFWNNKIKTNDFASGLDCSGLVMWSFNRANDPGTPRDRNIVKYEGADGQYRNNLDPDVITTDNLQQGDLLFFSSDGETSAFKYHVAMYVGGDEIVEAFSPDLGVIHSDLNERAGNSNFIGQFSRIANANVGASFNAASPVDLSVTDPDGFTISSATTIETEEEYLREVPGELYYSEMTFGDDGRPADSVYAPLVKDGVYTITVTPDETAVATSTYSLTFTSGSTTVALASNELVANIPPQGFAIEVTNDGKTIEEKEVSLTPDLLIELLETQIDVVNTESPFLKKWFQIRVGIIVKLYEYGRMRAVVSLLEGMRHLVEKRVDRNISEEDAIAIIDTIDKLLILLDINEKHEYKYEKNHDDYNSRNDHYGW